MSKLRVGFSLFMVALALAVCVSSSAAATQLTVRLDPALSDANVGDQFTLDLRVDNVTALNSVDIRLTYPANALDVLDMDALTVGTQITPGPFLQPDQVCANSAENGVIRYCVGQLTPHLPVSGSGVIARITFRTKINGSFTVAIDRAQSFLYRLNDPTPMAVDLWGDATITVPKQPVILTGTIKRQSWSVYDRSAVWSVFMVGPNQFATPILNPVNTNLAGAFRVEMPGGGVSLSNLTGSASSPPASIFPLPNCPVTALPYRAAYIWATYPNYLPNASWVCLSNKTTNAGTATLLGGDVNNDSCINILDITLIISKLGQGSSTSCSPTDINGDCRVDVSDLAIATGNFGLCGPTRWAP